jgi:hypothetical protein
MQTLLRWSQLEVAAAAASSSSATVNATDGDPTYRVWTWGGKMGRPFPHHSVYPKRVTLKNIHDLFYEGIPAEQIRPFKCFKGTDLHNKTECQTHSTAKNLVAEIDKYLPANYSVQTASVRDSLFVTAFEAMTDAFLAVLGGEKRGLHR